MAIDRLCEISFQILHILNESLSPSWKSRASNRNQGEQKSLTNLEPRCFMFWTDENISWRFLCFYFFPSPIKAQEVSVIDEHEPPTSPAPQMFIHLTTVVCLTDTVNSCRFTNSLAQRTFIFSAEIFGSCKVSSHTQFHNWIIRITRWWSTVRSCLSWENVVTPKVYVETSILSLALNEKEEN